MLDAFILFIVDLVLDQNHTLPAGVSEYICILLIARPDMLIEDDEDFTLSLVFDNPFDMMAGGGNGGNVITIGDDDGNEEMGWSAHGRKGGIKPDKVGRR